MEEIKTDNVLQAGPGPICIACCDDFFDPEGSGSRGICPRCWEKSREKRVTIEELKGCFDALQKYLYNNSPTSVFCGWTDDLRSRLIPQLEDRGWERGGG